MDFISYISSDLVLNQDILDISHHSEYSAFDFIGFRGTSTSINLISLVKADRLNEKEIVRIRDDFFEITRSLPKEFDLKAKAFNPNGLLCLIFEDISPIQPFIKYIQMLTKVYPWKGGVVVTWLIDCKTAKVYTHKNPVSKIPPVIILPQYAYPGIRYIEGFLSGYVSNKFSNNFIYEIKQNEEKIKQKNNYVFISYANEDKIFAEHLYYDLQKAEIKVWIDTINIIPGQIRKMEIHKALTESRFYIPIISTNSVSKVGRFHSELRIALEILDKYPCTKTFIIPMRIEECSPLHPRIEEIHWVDMFPSWEDGINKIIKSIKHS